MYSLHLATDADAVGVVSILNKHLRQPIHPAAFLRWEGRRLASPDFVRYVAVDAEGAVVGTAGARTGPGLGAGLWQVQTYVDPAHARRGIGTALYTTLEAAMHKRGAARVHADIRERDEASARWATNFGFAEAHRLWEGVLDLQRWDPARFAPAIATLSGQGVRFEAVAAGGANQTRLESLLAEIDPAADVTPPFEGVTVAMDGDEWIGVTMLRHLRGGGLYSEFTGVVPAWRGRGVALALKAYALGQARVAGALSVRVENHTDNPPMLAINRRLGYVAEPGLIGLRKAFRTA